MRIVDTGSGAPIVVVPGMQGRWEWMRPTVDALARRCRVVTFSLADEPSARCEFDPTDGFWSYVEQIRRALDAAHLVKAAICGVSYGGLIASAFAARYPDRASALILVSAIPPSWTPDARARFYMRAPRLLFPAFLVSSLRLYPEIAAAAPGLVPALRSGARYAWTALTHHTSPVRMARRIRLLASVDLRNDLACVRLPTLVITGTPELDRVVPVRATREYASLWPDARFQTLDRTGHLGLITRADAFAAIVTPFVETAWRNADQRRRVV